MLTETRPLTIAITPAVPTDAAVEAAAEASHAPADPRAPAIAEPRAAHPPGTNVVPTAAAVTAAAMTLFFC